MKIKTIVVSNNNKTHAYHKAQVLNAICSMRKSLVPESIIQLATQAYWKSLS